MKGKNNVNHPDHYNTGGIECIDAMIASQGVEDTISFCICNAFKYIWRCKHKKKYVEDLKKAAWYIDKAIELNGGFDKLCDADFEPLDASQLSDDFSIKLNNLIGSNNKTAINISTNVIGIRCDEQHDKLIFEIDNTE